MEQVSLIEMFDLVTKIAFAEVDITIWTLSRSFLNRHHCLSNSKTISSNKLKRKGNERKKKSTRK